MKPSEITTEDKLEFAGRILTVGRALTITDPAFHWNDTILNSVQLLNFLDFYFNDLSLSNTGGLLLNYQSHDETPHPNKNGCNTNSRKLITLCFPCSACSLKFSFEQTFQMHLNRRSVQIHLFCIKCNTFKTFYNKCKLFYHIYSHRHNLYEPMYRSVFIDLVPGEKLNLNKEGTLIDLRGLFDNLNKFVFDSGASDLTSQSLETNEGAHLQSFLLQPDGVAADVNAMLLNSRFKITPKDMSDARMFVRSLLGNKFTVFRCNVCDALFIFVEELKKHYHQTLNNEIDLIQMQTQTNKKLNPAVLYRNQIKILRQLALLNGLCSDDGSSVAQPSANGAKNNDAASNKLSLNMSDNKLNL
jgi:hypothetical protein